MTLEPAALKLRACGQTGLDDFGDAPLDEGLDAMCRSLAVEANLTAEGVEAAEGMIVSTLIERLKVEAWLAGHPEILGQPVAPILLVIGLPRSGTTAFAQHLSEDPRARSVRRWESTNLIPEPGAPGGDADPRIAAAREAFAAGDAAMPWRRAILPVAYDDPAEHGVLMGLTFRNLHFPTLFRVPSYEAWLLQADLTPGYAYLAKVLKLLQAQRPAAYWNLKHPPDLFGLGAIEATFPGTRYVWSHRNPLKSISSVCSLCAALREKQGKAASVDKGEIGPTQLEFEYEGARRAMAARDRIGEARFVDVYQADLARDLPGTIGALYDRLGMAFTDGFRRSLEHRMATKPRGRFGSHVHHLEEFGLTEQRVLDRFAGYIDRFRVPLDR